MIRHQNADAMVLASAPIRGKHPLHGRPPFWILDMQFRSRTRTRTRKWHVVPMYGYATPFSRRLWRPRPRSKSAYHQGWMSLISALARTMASAFWWRITVTYTKIIGRTKKSIFCLPLSMTPFTLCLGRHSGCLHVLSRTSQIYACFEKIMRVCTTKTILFCYSSIFVTEFCFDLIWQVCVLIFRWVLDVLIFDKCFHRHDKTTKLEALLTSSILLLFQTKRLI
jgi:hypothetical protein